MRDIPKRLPKFVSWLIALQLTADIGVSLHDQRVSVAIGVWDSEINWLILYNENIKSNGGIGDEIVVCQKALQQSWFSWVFSAKYQNLRHSEKIRPDNKRQQRTLQWSKLTGLCICIANTRWSLKCPSSEESIRVDGFGEYIVMKCCWGMGNFCDGCYGPRNNKAITKVATTRTLNYFDAGCRWIWASSR